MSVIVGLLWTTSGSDCVQALLRVELEENLAEPAGVASLNMNIQVAVIFTEALQTDWTSALPH